MALSHYVKRTPDVRTLLRLAKVERGKPRIKQAGIVSIMGLTPYPIRSAPLLTANRLPCSTKWGAMPGGQGRPPSRALRQSGAGSPLPGGLARDGRLFR
jgi:hypothetical protein